MNALVVMTDVGMPVTNTMAIADGTENEHKSVIQLVRTYLADLEEFGGVAFEMRPFETPGGTQRREVAVLNEQQSTLLLTYMRNSDIVRKFKKALVKAFFDLASKARQAHAIALPNFTDPAAAAIAWAAEYQAKQEAQVQVVQLESKVESMTPKVAAFDKLAVAEGSDNPTVVGKSLGLGQRQMFKLLSESGWIYKRAGSRHWTAYQDKIQSGYLEHKIHIQHMDDGTERVNEQVLITPKGRAKLALLVVKKS